MTYKPQISAEENFLATLMAIKSDVLKNHFFNLGAISGLESQIFNLADSNKNGAITKAEALDAVKRLQAGSEGKKAVEQLFEKKNEVTREELAEAMKPIVGAIAKFDKDGDGKVHFNEIDVSNKQAELLLDLGKAQVPQLAPKIDEAKKLIPEIDADKDNRVSLEEALKSEKFKELLRDVQEELESVKPKKGVPESKEGPAPRYYHPNDFSNLPYKAHKEPTMMA